MRSLYRWLIILYRSFYSPIVHRWYSLLVVLAYSMLRYSRDWFSLIFIDIFFVPDQNLDIIPFSTFEMWVYIHNFTTNPPLILYPIFEMNLCSLIIFSWLMLIKFGIFKSNIDVWEWLLGTLLTRAMKGTSQGKYDTWWWRSYVYFLVERIEGVAGNIREIIRRFKLLK